MVKQIAILILCSTLPCLAIEAQAAETFLNAGVGVHTVEYDTGDESVDSGEYHDNGYHLGFGIRSAHGSRGQHLFGFGVDVDRIHGQQLLGFRALDYQYEIAKRFRLGAFFGAASLDSGLPQNGYYGGYSVTLLSVWKNMDLSLEVKAGDGLGRDRLLESDPEGPRQDIFVNFVSGVLMLNWRF